MSSDAFFDDDVITYEKRDTNRSYIELKMVHPNPPETP
jgi:hypothetical protein